MVKSILRRPWVQARLAAAVGSYLSFALRTTRWQVEGEQHFAPHAAGLPAVAAFWHECLPLMPALWLRTRSGEARAHVLVSRHNDGRLIGAIVRRFGVEVVHGSTARSGQDKGGAASVRRLLGVLRGGHHVVLTPDGPRGPRRVAAPGVAQLAALSGAPVLPCGAATSRRWVLGTWDGMILPLPWGRGVIVCEPAIAVPRAGWEAALPMIAAAMTMAAERAVRMCR